MDRGERRRRTAVVVRRRLKLYDQCGLLVLCSDDEHSDRWANECPKCIERYHFMRGRSRKYPPLTCGCHRCRRYRYKYWRKQEPSRDERKARLSDKEQRRALTE